MDPTPPIERQCTAKSKRSQVRCKRWATTGKDTCRMHGGRPIKHGLYSKYGAPPALADKIAEYQRDPELLSHVRIGALVQALLGALFEKIEASGKPTPEQIEAMLPVVTELRRVSTDWHRIATDKRFVDVLAAKTWFAQGLERVLRHVPEHLRELALADFEAVIGGEDGGSGVAGDTGSIH